MNTSEHVQYQTKRVSAGYYEMRNGSNVVTIMRNRELSTRGGQWVAVANWDRYLYSDPLYTMAEAKEAAHYMLIQARYNSLVEQPARNGLEQFEHGIAIDERMVW